MAFSRKWARGVGRLTAGAALAVAAGLAAGDVAAQQSADLLGSWRCEAGVIADGWAIASVYNIDYLPEGRQESSWETRAASDGDTMLLRFLLSGSWVLEEGGALFETYESVLVVDAFWNGVPMPEEAIADLYESLRAPEQLQIVELVSDRMVLDSDAARAICTPRDG